MRPKSLEDLTKELKELPGVTRKQAEKIAYFLCSSDKQSALSLSNQLVESMSSIKRCKICNHLTDNDVCDICLDQNRTKILVVVESSLDVFKFEESENFKPYYHVLNGLIKVDKNLDKSSIDINKLIARAQDYNEIILALSPNLEGIVTSNYIRSSLTHKKVTQLAQGIPLGAAMEYVDGLTLKAAIDNRREME